jgi:very-short-patch-repair endonuclease
MHGEARVHGNADDPREVFGGPSERERATANLASRQHGVITRRQLVSLGLSEDQTDNRLKTGRFQALHRGVYLLGAVAPPHAPVMAAVLACGRGAVGSHRTAAVLWLLLPARQSQVPEVTVAGRNPQRRRGIRIHRVAMLDPSEVGTCKGIPVTSPARTLLDIAAEVHIGELERALAEAQRRGLVTGRELSSVLARNRGRRGAPALRRVHEGSRALMTRSESERRLLALIRKAGLPQPEANIRVDRFEVDFFWREQRLVVEVDGFAFHSSRAAFERDRRRDGALQAVGIRVIRVTWRQIVNEPEATVALLARALMLTPASPRGRGAAP